MTHDADASDPSELLEWARECMHGVLARSATDPEFRAELLRDPRAAIGAYLGCELPDGFNLVFVESAGAPTIVLPPFVGSEGQAGTPPDAAMSLSKPYRVVAAAIGRWFSR